MRESRTLTKSTLEKWPASRPCWSSRTEASYRSGNWTCGICRSLTPLAICKNAKMESNAENHHLRLYSLDFSLGLRLRLDMSMGRGISYERSLSDHPRFLENNQDFMTYLFCITITIGFVVRHCEFRRCELRLDEHLQDSRIVVEILLRYYIHII